MPAYNCASLIEQTILSVINGNFDSGDEIIIVEDCSTDNTWSVIQDLALKHNVIRIFKHDYNKGTAAAGRNTAIGKAKHDIIFALDADNLLVPGSVKKLKEYMLDQSADAAAFGEMWYFEDDQQNIQDRILYPKLIEFADFFTYVSTPGPSGNYMFTKQSWLKAGKYFEPTIINQTLDSWTFAVWQVGTGSKMVTLPNTYYLHRKTRDSHFMREKDRSNRSLAALVAVLPFLDQLYPHDINYIMGRGRYKWVDNLWRRQLRLRDGSKSVKRCIGYDKYGKPLPVPHGICVRLIKYILRKLRLIRLFKE